ncbi:hypothetical protein OIO90_003189 [Microbotryomycetes sp. JL221]|nr:hypothetical protein OIO90_003189 [Microbotryomycetes sp. JL221]
MVLRSVVGAVTVLSLLHAVVAQQQYTLTQRWQGTSFFDGWQYYGKYDNLTNGDVNFVNQSDSASLTYVNDNGNAIIKVDDSSFVPYNEKRSTVRITSDLQFGIGSLWVMDAVHVPYGCSVWPAFWSHAPVWPAGGEIDTFEGVNLFTRNQMALHTRSGCTVATSTTSQTGNLTYGNCDANVNSNSGCTVVDPNTNSYGAAFAQAGGGLWATELADTGISIWFFSRNDVPSDLDVATNSSAVPNPSSWGTPTAFYPSSSCDIQEFFQPQQLTFTITLCGDWAGNAVVYNQTCQGVCYVDNVIGNGSNYQQAYFEVQHVSVYTLPNATVVNSTDSGASELGSGSPSSSGQSGSSSPSPTSQAQASVGLSKLGALVVAAISLWVTFV